MSKIIYLNQEVKLGEVITYQGLEVEVTQTLIDNNPDTFKVIDEREGLLDKAKRDYPVGTVFKSLFGNICTVENNPCYYSFGAYDSILIDGIYVYRDGRWAEVLPLKFITEDGVSIYGDMKTYAVSKGNLDIDNSEIYNGDSHLKCYKYFYHKENALAYIEKHKEKTLRYYEKMLFKSESSVIFSDKGSYFSIYAWIRDNEPKLYYTKILQLIADDLNDGKRIHRSEDTSYHISDEFSVNVHCGGDEGCVYFKSNELAQRARSILGDKVKYLFN